MRLALYSFALLIASANLSAKTIPADISGVKPGPVSVTNDNSALQIAWEDGNRRHWQASFSLDTAKPVIAGVQRRWPGCVGGSEACLSLLDWQAHGRMGPVLRSSTAGGRRDA